MSDTQAPLSVRAVGAKRSHAGLRAWLSVAAVVGLFGLSSAHADVNVLGAINADTTWTAANSPYVLLDTVTVQPGVTLTIQPGVTVIGTASSYSLVVNGTLAAEGTPAAPIVFRGNNAAPNSWEGIDVRGNGSISLRHAELRDADNALLITEPASGSQVLEDLYIHNFNTRGVRATAVAVAVPHTLSLQRVRVMGDGVRSTYGFDMNNVALDLNVGEVSGHLSGVRQTSAPVSLTRVVLADNQRVAVETISAVNRNFLTACDHCTLVRNGNADNQAANGAAFIVTRNNSSTSGALSFYNSILLDNRRLVYDGNASYDYTLAAISENVWSGPATFAGIGVPASFATLNLQVNPLLVNAVTGDYRITDRSPARYWSPNNPANVAGALAFDGAPTGPGVHGYWYQSQTLEAGTQYDVLGDVVITRGNTLTLRPGTTLRMAANTDLMAGGVDTGRIEIEVQGTLEADGTLNRPVVLTSAAAVPAPGDWYGIRIIQATEAFNISQVDLGYGRYCVHLEQNPHIVAGSRIHHCSEAGILIDGGTPTVEEVIVEDSRRGMWIRNQANVSVQIDPARQGPERALIARRNTLMGLYIERSNVVLADSAIYDNGSYGVQVTSTGDSRTLDVTRTIIAHNTGEGLYTTRSNSSSGLTVNLDSSALTHNTAAGFRSTNASYPTTLSCARTNNWGNASTWSGVSAPAGSCFAENPLYADEAGRNYAPTRWSPHRGLGAGGVPGSPIGGTVGPFPYIDAVGPQIMGYLWENFAFTRQGSPYTLLGDVTVPAGVTVTVEPGVEFRVTGNADGMGGGVSVSRTEMRFLANSVGVFGTAPNAQPALGIAGEPIVFRPVGQPNALNWYGLRFEDSPGSSIYNLSVENPTYGLYITGPRAPEVKYFTALGPQAAGIYAADVLAASPVRAHGARLIGPNRNGGNGIYLVNSDARISSSFVTHFSNGVFSDSSTNRAKETTLVNNTIVKTRNGLYYRRGNSSSVLTITAYNTVIADSSVKAIFDGNASYRSTDRFYHTSLFNNTTRDHAANSWQAGIVVDPLIEDTDWDDAPRWWDGQVWAESPTIGVGFDEALPFPVTTDILGRPRTIGARTDLGAWEFDPAANQEPRADAVTDAIMVPRGEAFTLDGSAARDPDGQIAAAFWTMSDGTITGGLTVQHTFAAEGSDRWAYLTIVDDDGAEDHALVQVNVNVRPIADAGPQVFQDEGPDEVVFFDGTLSTDPDGQIVRWQWNFGDGGTSEESSPRHSYLSAGLYTVRLTVTDNEGLTHTDTTIATVYGDLDIVGPLVEHTEINDGQPVNQPVVVRATIRDPAGVTNAILFFRPIGGQNTQFAIMQLVGNNVYEGIIPANAVTAAGVEYWILAADGVEPDANNSLSPSGAPDGGVYNFLVLGDPDAPAIVHAPVPNGQPPGQAVAINATVTDATGVAEVLLYFRVVGGNVFGAVAMSRVGQTTAYTAQIPGFVVGEAGVEYYLEARDTSPLPNTGRLPALAPASLFRFTVQRNDQQPPVIAHVPIANNQLENQPVNIEASIVDADGRVDTALVYYRVVGQPAYVSAPLAFVSGSTWRGSIPGAAVTRAGVQYYLAATDDSANTATDPAGAPGGGAHLFTVTADDRVGPTVQHTAIADGRPANQNVTVEATVTDPSGVSAVQVYYRPIGFPVYQQTAMAAVPGTPNLYRGTIPGFSVTAPGVQYYIRGTDTQNNQGYAPAAAPATVLTFTVGDVDAQGPTIVHTPVVNGRPQGQAVNITATVTDATGVASVILSFRAQGGGAFTDLPLSRGANDVYAGAIPAAAVQGAALEYHLTATDTAAGANTRRDPVGGEHTFTLSQPDLTGPTVVVTPVADGRPEGSPVVVTATITDAVAMNPASAGTLVWGPPGGPYGQAPLTAAGGDTYSATIPGADVDAPAVTYYVVGTDAAGNQGFDAAFTAANPGRFTVTPVVAPDNTPPVIVHAPIANAAAGGAVLLDVTATDNVGVSAVAVFFRPSGGAFLNAACTRGAVNAYTCTVPAFAVAAPGFAYYLRAVDAANNGASLPAAGAASPYNVSVVADPVDAQAPVITHTPPAGPIQPGQPFDLSATITDATGIGTARLHFRNEATGEEPWLSLDLLAGENGEYTVRIPGAAITGPSLSWYFEARDTTAARLRAYDPSDAPNNYHNVEVEAVDATGPSIEAAVPALSTAGLAITISALVTDPSGVDEVTLRYLSPAAGVWINAPMQPDAQADTFVASVPGGLAVAPGVEVVIIAVDTLGNASQSPAAGEADPWFVTVEAPAELSPPVIVHSPPASAQRDAPLALTARISDASGVASARVQCRSGDEEDFEIIDLRLDNGDRWSATLPATCLAGAEVSYFFEATDASPQANRATEPLDAPEDLFRVVTLGNSPDPDQGVEADMGTADMMVIIVGDMGVEADEGIENDLGTEADLGNEADLGPENDLGSEADQGPENDMGIEADSGIENDMGIAADTGIEADRGTNDGGPIADQGNERDGGLTGPDGGNTSDGGNTPDGGEAGSAPDDGGCACNVSQNQPASPAFLLLGLLALIRRRRRG